MTALDRTDKTKELTDDRRKTTTYCIQESSRFQTLFSVEEEECCVTAAADEGAPD